MPQQRTFFSPSSSSSSKSLVINHQPRDFATLPHQVIVIIAKDFTVPNLREASLVCKAWRDAFQPLKDALSFLKSGKGFKIGNDKMEPDLGKALDSFLKAVELGSTLAMVEAGMLYWEMGKREEAIFFYRKAAELNDIDGRSKLVNSYLQADRPNYPEAVKWLYKAAFDLLVRPQYQLALCVRPGSGLHPKLLEATRKCYMDATRGGHVRPINKFTGEFSNGHGVVLFYIQVRQWMQRAGERGDSKAQFEDALILLSEGKTEKAMIRLERASEAGETAATQVKNAILQQFSATFRDRANNGSEPLAAPASTTSE